MPPSPSSTSLQVESVVFPPSVNPPATTTTLFLAGAGVRGMEIQGKFVKLSGIGIYLEDKAISSLADKWKGKTAAELADSVEFYSDIITGKLQLINQLMKHIQIPRNPLFCLTYIYVLVPGPFEKLAEVAMLVPVVGTQHAEKVSEMCVAIWKAQGTYIDADSATIDKFLEVFKDKNFSLGSSILYTTSPAGLVTIHFSKDGTVPETPAVVLENEKFGQALFESVIGENGISPEAKQSLASRLYDLMKQFDEKATARPSSTSIQVEFIVFPPSVKPPGATTTLFLGGAGVRGMEIQGNFVKFTGIGVYLEDKAIPSLAGKWKGKTAAELKDSVQFYRDIVTGPFEKFTQVTMILPLTGKQYSEKVSEMCIGVWKAQGTYTDADTATIEKFLQVFKDENFLPGSSILFTTSPNGSLTVSFYLLNSFVMHHISFSKDGIIPEVAIVVLENEKLAQAVIESVIGEHGVSPATKQSLASRLSEFMNQVDEKATTSVESKIGLESQTGL
ncbi:Chalcone isomerase [Cynara cardunculus var. scolymus]|uniref:Chalcone-flavonone isomerase family protein n=1 Tax=Cynara cardunculus var. scolymus TaxID=59895 RepID=A0A124SGN7_CYNCS|nr:Chalcone isomerase [Cynara cardunculus var. scolymus]